MKGQHRESLNQWTMKNLGERRILHTIAMISAAFAVIMCVLIIVIGVLPQTVARRSLQNLNIEIRQLEDEWALRRFRVCVRARDALTPAAAKMLAHLQEVAGPDVASPG